MEFLDREHELAMLKEHLDRPGAGMFVLYGRRRIGKTALLGKMLETRRDAAYHVATRSTATEELRRLSATLAREWDVPFLAAQPFASFEALLAFLEGLSGLHVLVLDEFPFLVESEPALPGLLQAAWDRRLVRTKLKLVFCGSSVGMMEDTFLSERSPLFGRRTGQLKLGPLAPHHLHRAFPWKPEQIVELAALFGGTPGYIEKINPDVDLFSNLRNHVLRRGEPLYEEIPFMLREELREPRVYHSILATIASGSRKFGEISSKVGLDRANLTRYLAVLAELGLIEREVPVSETHPEKSRKGLYRIADPFVSTWFAFVHPNRDMLERGKVDEVIPDVRSRLSTYMPSAVEPVIREMLRSGPLSRLVPFPVAAAGREWSASSEYDVVLIDKTRSRAFIAEIKWTSGKVSPRLLDDLARRVSLEPALRKLKARCALISRNGFHGHAAAGPGGLLVDISRESW